MKNHTATHLLQAALMQLFGNQIKQSGSLVHPDYLRFDFTYHGTLSDADIKQVEDIVNEKIRQNIAVDVQQMPYRDAVELSALAFFGDKYNPEKVRVVNVPEFSVELCGGTHVTRTGDIGLFKITQESALAAGHRRIFALTGPKTLALFQENFNSVKNLSQLFKVKREQVLETVEKLFDEHKNLEREFKKVQQQALKAEVTALESKIEEVNGIPFLFATFHEVASDTLKDALLALAQKKPGFYFFVSTFKDRVLFVAYTSDQFLTRIDMKALGAWLKEEAQLQGGGSKNMLQGGGASCDVRLQDKLKERLK